VPYPKVYNVNFWVDGSITALGAVASLLALPGERNKDRITGAEFQSLDRNLLNPFDRWALNIQTSNISTFETYSTYTQFITALLPVSLFFTDRIKDDWANIFLMYLEANSVAVTIYVATPLGPLFQNKYRPIVYHDELSEGDRSSGNNRNSFYSGHVASATTATFFMAKVYCDYHPELGCDKYWFYGAAMVPPLVMSYFRLKAYDHFPSDIVVGMGVGALVGIMVPELHHVGGKDISLGLFSSPTKGTGLTMQWDVPTHEVAAQRAQ
jgi:membrane-associated phospholipid phosphatase